MTRRKRIQRVLHALESDVSTPWYLVEIVRDLLDLEHEHESMVDHVSLMNVCQEEQISSIQRLKDQYSEVLYKLKSGD